MGKTWFMLASQSAPKCDPPGIKINMLQTHCVTCRMKAWT